MSTRSGRDGDLDAWVLLRKGWELCFEEEAVESCERVLRGREKTPGGECALHAPTAAGPIAVVEVEAFALEDECAHAVLLARQ